MDLSLITGADAVGMFCRLHMNSKRDLPIRPSEMGVLIFTQKQLQPVTPLQISQFFNIAKPSVSAMVKVLLKQGYLIKEDSIEDKRSYQLSVTEKGSALVESTFSEYLKNMTLLKEKMGAAEFDQFIALIKLSNDILEGEK